MLGVLAFVVSQILIRIPILNYVNGTSTDFQMFSVMQPILFAVLLSISAGIFEEIGSFYRNALFYEATRLAVWFYLEQGMVVLRRC